MRPGQPVEVGPYQVVDQQLGVASRPELPGDRG